MKLPLFKFGLVGFLVIATTGASLAKPATAVPGSASKIRTFLDCPNLPRESLRNGVSPKFYKSLTISPLEAYIVVQSPLNGSKAGGARVVHSEAGGAFDEVGLALANSMHVTGLNYVESNLHVSSINVHLLIYKIADGIMAVGFSHVDDSRYAEYRQYGRATIGFLRNGKWTFMDNK